MSNSGEFIKVIENIVLNILNGSIHTCLPGKITSYDSKTRKATVQPLIKKKYLDGTTASYKPVEAVPVLFFGIGNSGIRLPESQYKGKSVLLVVSERSLDTWLVGNGKEVTPQSNRKFDISDCIAIISLNTFSNKDIGGNNLEVYYKDSVIRIKPNGDIELGLNTFKKLINESFADLFDNHVHTVSVAGTPLAQTGVTSSPSKLTGILPVAVPAVPTVQHLFNDSIMDNHKTEKVKAE